MRKLLLLVVVFMTISAVRAAQYSVVDLGYETIPKDINNNGQVVGSIRLTHRSDEQQYAFIWENDTIRTIGPMGGEAMGVNDSCQVIGRAEHTFMWWNETTLCITQQADYSQEKEGGINNNGDAVGTIYTKWGHGKGYIWKNWTFTTFTVPGFSYCTHAFAVNDSGAVTGWADATDRDINPNLRRAYVIDGDNTTILDPLPNHSKSYAIDINNKGQVAGYSQITGDYWIDRAVIWENGIIRDLGLLPGFDRSWSTSINDAGQVVGYARKLPSYVVTSGINHAFVWQEDIMYDLNNLISADSGWILEHATSINDRGQIIGWGSYEGQKRGFLLNPVPEPSSLVSLGLAVSALGLKLIKKKEA